MMRAPAGRGLVAFGNAAGQLVLADPRTGKGCLACTVRHIELWLPGSLMLMAVWVQGSAIFCFADQSGCNNLWLKA